MVKARSDKTQGLVVVGRSVFVDAMSNLMAKRYRPSNAILGEEKAKCQAARFGARGPFSDWPVILELSFRSKNRLGDGPGGPIRGTLFTGAWARSRGTRPDTFRQSSHQFPLLAHPICPPLN